MVRRQGIPILRANMVVLISMVFYVDPLTSKGTVCRSNHDMYLELIKEEA